MGTIARTLQVYRLWAGILAIAGAAVLCGYFVNSRAFAMAEGLLLAVSLGVLIPWVSLWGSRVNLALSRSRAREGETIRGQVSVSQRGWWPIRAGDLRFRGGDVSTPLPDVAPRSLKTETVSVHLERRGRFTSSDFWLSTSWPFGFARATRRVQGMRPLTVWPQPCLPPLPLIPFLEEAVVDGYLGSRDGTLGDIRGVRPFRRGDRLRRVHWGQTARLDQLMVTELQCSMVPKLTIEVDLCPTHHIGLGKDATLEWAIRIAAGLAEQALREGGGVSLRLGPEHWEANTYSGFESLMDALAVASLLPVDALSPVSRNKESRASRILITTDLAELSQARPEDVSLIQLETSGFGGTVALPAAPQQRPAPWLVMSAPGRWVDA